MSCDPEDCDEVDRAVAGNEPRRVTSFHQTCGAGTLREVVVVTLDKYPQHNLTLQSIDIPTSLVFYPKKVFAEVITSTPFQHPR